MDAPRTDPLRRAHGAARRARHGRRDWSRAPPVASRSRWLRRWHPAPSAASASDTADVPPSRFELWVAGSRTPRRPSSWTPWGPFAFASGKVLLSRLGLGLEAGSGLACVEPCAASTAWVIGSGLVGRRLCHGPGGRCGLRGRGRLRSGPFVSAGRGRDARRARSSRGRSRASRPEREHRPRGGRRGASGLRRSGGPIRAHRGAGRRTDGGRLVLIRVFSEDVPRRAVTT
jgi:hypothetical protein